MVQSFENLHKILRNWAKDKVQTKSLVKTFIEQVQEKQEEER